MSTDTVEITDIDPELSQDIIELNRQAMLSSFVDVKGDLYMIGARPEGSHELVINDGEAFKTFAALFAPAPGMN